MDRARKDPNYQLHEEKRPTRERGGPRTDDPGQEDRGERPDESFLEVNKRLNSSRPDPEQVRETEREHGTPSAPREP